ncbi:hypothetical protein TGVAND_271790 [Toxoplasma gondii VAND]|uniref:Uncharacterized protein n=1 Tax=Toxoplasma gondii VAND TaxID=933077 RepID=A0A086QGV6_TOXGO|nr:hypothetical protein TGVAND_271790 [Toxoplasma gondii VAND]
MKEEVCKALREGTEQCLPSDEESPGTVEPLGVEELTEQGERTVANRRPYSAECEDAVVGELRERIRQRLARHKAFLLDVRQLLGERNFYFDKLSCIQRKILDDYGGTSVGRKVLAIIGSRPADF